MWKKIITIVFFSVSCFLQVEAQKELAPADFEKSIGSQKTQLLDVRTAEEYRTGHLKNSLQADWLNKAQFADRVKYLSKDQQVLVYCASGMRSGQAADWLRANGFNNVQNMKGGMYAWKMEGRPIEAATPVAQLTIEQYLAATSSATTVLVDFGAEWCPPCKKMEPVLQELQKELPGRFSLVKVDGGNDIDVMKAMKVDGIPVFIVYKNGKETWRKQGVVDKEELKKQLSN